MFGTLKVQSFILTEVSDCGLLIIVTSSSFLKRKVEDLPVALVPLGVYGRHVNVEEDWVVICGWFGSCVTTEE